MPERALGVIHAGPLTTLQDLGRPGWAHVGVPRSGAADLTAHRLANRLVDNHAEAATLEVTLGGLVVRMETAATLALTGAIGEVVVNGIPRGWGCPVTVTDGEVVEIPNFDTGLRGYLALSGGVLAEPVLGSLSTDVLSGLGPPVVRAGQRLLLGPDVGVPQDVVGVVPRIHGSVRLIWGPRAEWITSQARRALVSSSYVVAADSNRIAVRLDGPVLTRTASDEMPSEGLVLGAVQIPPSGRPVIFLADHPVTGGYPVVAVVHPDDIALVAQRRPGEEVRFTLGPGRGDAVPGLSD